jgi:signal transduction histidine kinase
VIPLSHLDDIILIAAVCALAAAVGGALALRLLRSAALATSLLVVVLVPVGSVAAGSLGTARAMFLSGHDLRVLLIVLGVSTAVGVTTALVLSRAVVRGSAALGLSARALGDGAYAPAGAPLTAELARLDEALQDAARRLEESRRRERALERSRRELVAWMSHDLRTPLAGIRAMAEALEDGVVDDPATVHRYQEGLRREAERLGEMVDDLFELSRINAESLHLSLSAVSLADVVSDAVASAVPVAAAQGVRLEGSAGSPAPVVAGSEPELGRVLRNLLANAIRHTPQDGVVHVRAGTADGVAFVEVADSCGGVPEDDLPRLFDVGFRGTAARTPGDGGAGLGLAIARGLVEAHEGDISVRNAGAGCAVVVRLPAVPVQARP